MKQSHLKSRVIHVPVTRDEKIQWYIRAAKLEKRAGSLAYYLLRAWLNNDPRATAIVDEQLQKMTE